VNEPAFSTLNQRLDCASPMLIGSPQHTAFGGQWLCRPAEGLLQLGPHFRSKARRGLREEQGLQETAACGCMGSSQAY